MINFNDVKGENIKKHNPNLPPTCDHFCKILMIGGSELGKINVFFNLMSHQRNIYKICLHLR